jgi:hypothetical protein
MQGNFSCSQYESQSNKQDNNKAFFKFSSMYDMPLFKTLSEKMFTARDGSYEAENTKQF